MKEILPDIYHWTAVHPEIEAVVSSYYLAEAGILLDPLIPEEGLEWFNDRRPQHVFLSSGLHDRHSGKFRDAFRCLIWVHQEGIRDGIAGGEVERFGFGDALPGKVEAVKIDALCDDETAFFIPRDGGILAFADGIIREEDGPLEFVPDELMADAPQRVKEIKKDLKTAFRRCLDDYEFDHLFFAHGSPMIGGGRAALEKFVL